MKPVSVIAIDGPAASGKSTLGAELARRLGYLYVDTGAMYRAATLAVLRRSISIEDERDVTGVVSEIEIDVRPPTKNDGRQNDILVDGEDVTWEIRSPEVDRNVSQVSMYSGVRDILTRRQREIGKRGRVVMVGRDIGTVVLPDADLKIYLDASAEARARRRYLENEARGNSLSYEEILQAVKRRDHIDSTRELAPLRVAGDAIVIDSTQLNITQVFDRVFTLVEDRG
ncbi:MAG: (d)CMP kinase [Anaerolineales bacterium]|jgi:cytidylate kinase